MQNEISFKRVQGFQCWGMDCACAVSHSLTVMFCCCKFTNSLAKFDFAINSVKKESNCILSVSKKRGIFLVYDFWTPPPPPINFVHWSDKKFLNLT